MFSGHSEIPTYRLGIASVLPVCHAVCSSLQSLHGCSHIRESLLLTHFKHCRHSVFHSFTQPHVYPHPFVSARLRSHRLRYGIVLRASSADWHPFALFLRCANGAYSCINHSRHPVALAANRSYFAFSLSGEPRSTRNELLQLLSPTHG